MRAKVLSVLAAGAASVFLAAPVQAAPGYCSAGLATEGIAASNMTFNTVAANDCYGMVDGNLTPEKLPLYANASAAYSPTPSEPSAITEPLWGGSWSYLVGTDSGGTTTLGGIQFTITAGVGSSSGTWTLTAQDTNGAAPLNLPLVLDFAAILKGGNELAFWFFDDRTVSAGANPGTFQIVFSTGGNPGGAGLSHLDLLWRDGGGTIIEIPEPASLALLGMGLLGLGVMRRRRG